MKRLPLICSILIVIAGRASFLMFSAEPDEKPEPDFIQKQFGLKPGAGRELVLAHCIPCHSTAIVAANHLDRKGWSDVVDQMQEKNGMIPVAPEIRQRILDYLEAAQRPDDAALTVGKQSPWAAPLYRTNPLWP